MQKENLSTNPKNEKIKIIAKKMKVRIASIKKNLADLKKLVGWLSDIFGIF